MIIFMYSDKNCEYQAISCIQSLAPRLRSTDKILYYTIGFRSQFLHPNLHKVKISLKDYPTFHYYKAELSLFTMDLFPSEDHYLFTDTDVLFSKRFSPIPFEHSCEYPLASLGPHEYPFTYETINGERIIYDETKLMNYYGVKQRSMRYVWSCIYSFNKGCTDFLEEYTSMCKNQYLTDRRKYYYPFNDETPFNVCLFKRGATKNLGFIFVNTHLFETVKATEENAFKNKHLSGNIDLLGANWQYVDDSDKVMLYHGFKDPLEIEKTLKYLIQ